jgi:threonine/homoserine/homoserine lactone efflux protein
MTDPIAFVLGVLALLATPGPTNTLLATSGAVAGIRRSLPLILAEIIGYMTSIHILALVIGPLVRASHVLSVGLRVACAAYLFYAAWRLWRDGSDALISDKPVRFRHVLVTTLLNPKAVVFAFVILPYLSQGQIAPALPYTLSLAAMIIGVAVSWISLGSALRAGAGQRINNGLVRRVGALVLCVFATVFSSSVLSA